LIQNLLILLFIPGGQGMQPFLKLPAVLDYSLDLFRLDVINSPIMAASKFYFVYKTTCILTGLIYVGAHRTNKLEDGYIGHGIYRSIKDSENVINGLSLAVKTYNYVNFKREILEFCSSLEEMQEREVYWQRKLDCTNPLVGYNLKISKAGGHKEDFKHSEEVIEKQREFMKGRVVGEKNPFYKKKHSDKTIKYLHDINIGKKHSNETKEKYKLRRGEKNGMFGKLGKDSPNYGQTRSKETKLKMRESAINRPLIECPHCNYQSPHKGLMIIKHFDNCPQNPNYVPKEDTRPLLTCTHCGYQCKNKGSMMASHFDKCRYR